MTHEIRHGDCLELMRAMPDNSVDAVVTDPPYGLAFMGKKWDYDVPSVEVWQECLRILKPGGHLLAFAGTRTQHRMAVRIEDAGFEIRDMIAWVYGSGFPKSLDVSKAIDKAAGAEREVIASVFRGERAGTSAGIKGTPVPRTDDITAPATDAAKQWQGWGTALKPALEPITVARKPLEGTVAANVLEHGTGALNVDGCRVEGEVTTWPSVRTNDRSKGNAYGTYASQDETGAPSAAGRWPANFIHDGSDEVVGLFPESGSGSGIRKAACGGAQPFATSRGWNSHNMSRDGQTAPEDYGDSGSAARFFYCAKSSRSERNKGLEGQGCTHPTVKPIALMRYLCRLVTPPGGTVLDPFTGSGTTGIAAKLEGFSFIGIEREAEYVAIARARIDAWKLARRPVKETAKSMQVEGDVHRKLHDPLQMELFT
jgi:DNA modification methylase